LVICHWVVGVHDTLLGAQADLTSVVEVLQAYHRSREEEHSDDQDRDHEQHAAFHF
jgi:hypothetical protein